MEFRNKELRPLFEFFNENAIPAFITFFDNKLKENNRLVNSYEKMVDLVFESKDQKLSVDELVVIHKNYKEKLHQLISEHQNALFEGNFDNLFVEFFEVISTKLAALDKTLSRKETVKSYCVKKGDNPIVFVRKLLVNTTYYTVRSLKQTANVFRKIFKVRLLEVITYRKRKIPYRSMAGHYFISNFAEMSLPLLKQWYELESSNMLDIWKIDEGLDSYFQQILTADDKSNNPEKVVAFNTKSHFRALKTDSRKIIAQIKSNTEESANLLFEVFDQKMLNVGSVELSVSAYESETLKRNRESVNRAYFHLSHQWRNTLYTLIDDWAVDVEVTRLYYAVYNEYGELKAEIDQFIKSKLNKNFAKIKSFINSSVERVKQADPSLATMPGLIIAEREKVNKQLIDNVLAQGIEMLTNCFSTDFDNLILTTNELSKSVSEKRGFVRVKHYKRGINDSEISTLSPRELLDIEAIPNFEIRVGKVKQLIEGQLEKVRVNLLSLGTVCDFTLESAFLLIDKEKKPVEESLETIVQGYDRALHQLSHAQQIITEIQTDSVNKLRDTVHQFNTDVLQLKNTDTLFELNIKITRIKAKEQSIRMREQSIAYLRGIFKKLLGFFVLQWQNINSGISVLKKRIGITTGKMAVLYELSEFMNETQLALKRLPFVYQRLYQIQPTDEERFFVNRVSELKQLKLAFENWQRERFITCAVVGEKGSGVSSLISFFLHSVPPEINIVRYTLGEKIFTNEKYFEMFGEIFGQPKFINNEALIAFLNEKPGTSIVILENLQHLFLKKINGFSCMKLFFDLMTHTSKKVMWVATYTPASWAYLDKTISTSNYFTDEIFIEQLSDSIIEEIIFKRNKLSGYQINFIPSDDDFLSKSYLKLSDTDKQLHLKKRFFSHLNVMSNGNISLAQLYWLRSTVGVDEQYINIQCITQLDFSFVKNLSGESLFALQTMLMHDGLTIEDFALTMNESESVCRNLLVPMLEKGLLIQPRLKYTINPLLYKYINEYLQSRNFIH